MSDSVDDGSDFYSIIKTGPVGSTSLAVGDYDNIDNTSGAIPHAGGNFKEYSNRIDLTGIGANQYQSFNLNATATAMIDTGGVVGFGVAEGHDILNSSFSGTSKTNGCVVNFAESANDPELIVEHSAGAATPASGSGLQNLTYTYDAVGNITRIADNSNTATYKTMDFGYDDLYRLTTASSSYASTSPDYKQTYGYNAIGNFATSSTQGTYSYSGTSYANPHAATFISTTTGMTLYYDNNGNLASTTKGSTITRYGWDYRNQLTSVATGTATSTFGYDFGGNRVSLRSTGNGSTTYPNQFFNKQGATTTKHVFAGGELVATIVGNGVSTSTYVVHTDQLGGTGVVTNASGTVVETMDNFPYGDARLDTGSYSDQRKYTGHEYDAATALTYMGARYYTGTRGHFLSEDPSVLTIPKEELVDPPTFNSYSYGLNNPLKYRDPDGIKAELVWIPLQTPYIGGDLRVPFTSWYPGAHTAIVITPSGGETLRGYEGASKVTISGDDDHGTLRAVVNRPRDYAYPKDKYLKSDVITPVGKTEQEYDQALLDEAKGLSGESLGTYSLFGNNGGFGHHNNSGNVTTQISYNTGGSVPMQNFSRGTWAADFGTSRTPTDHEIALQSIQAKINSIREQISQLLTSKK